MVCNQHSACVIFFHTVFNGIHDIVLLWKARELQTKTEEQFKLEISSQTKLIMLYKVK